MPECFHGTGKQVVLAVFGLETLETNWHGVLVVGNR